MLVGRESECARLEAMIADARAGVGGGLVLRGDPGIGKTALLAWVAERADGMAVLRVRGVESEIELAYAGLLEALRPALGALERLPAPQATALRGALGLGPAEARDRYLVGAATLSLIAAHAEDAPVVVLVDDVHWLDPSSAAALIFAARRLVADPAAMIFATRTGEPAAVDAAGLAELELAGLDAAAARMVLVRAAGGPVPPATADWLHAATGGNPLGLVELAAEAPHLGPAPVGAPVPLGAQIEGALRRRLGGLSGPARAALLVAAASDADDVAPVLRAAPDVGGSLVGLEEAERHGLLRLAAGRIVFQHPLVRSAAYAVASGADRRAAHRALARALDPADEDRRAWHEAAGTIDPDEAIAGRLAGAAARARERSAFAAAATAFERAARLSPEAVARAERLHAAADAAWLAGQVERALALVDEAEAGQPDRALAAELAHLRGQIAARCGPVREAVRVLLAGVDAIAALDPAKASAMAADAAYAAFHSAEPEVMTLAARRAVELAPPGDARATYLAAAAHGAALVMTGAGEEAVSELRRAAAQVAAVPERQDDPLLAAWLGITPTFLRESSAGADELRAATARARARGAIGALPQALFQLGADASGSGRWSEAIAYYEEGLTIARETGLRVDVATILAGLARIEARQGVPGAAVRADEALALTREVGLRMFESWALEAIADLRFVAGDVDGAIAALEAWERALREAHLLDVDLSPAPELVEAYLRIGRADDARAQARAHAERAAAKGRPWALARAQRALGLVAEDDFEAPFAAALEAHERTDDLFQLARTRLCLGERRRRDGRRADARGELRAALQAFERLGAAPWAERAREELAATGERARRRDPSALDELTPQELRIALLLSEGVTTRQAAEALFLSPKTIEYHLRHVYMKLGINDRVALAAALGADHRSSAMSAAARAAPSSGTAR
jgi:DNA-binding CsgD family transcriptional regulator/tetratricopeptide (TPR) repeat protein